MKKLAIFAAALLLTLGLTQCKKDQPAAQFSESGNIHITLKVSNDGSKPLVNTGTGHYSFISGEKLYVGYNGAKVGVLTYDGYNFSGDLSIVQVVGEQPLYFYYMGGMEATIDDATHYSVDISSQPSSAQVPVISCGTSTQPFAGAGEYTTTLYNKCGLVKFKTNVYYGTINVGGMNTKATIDFGSGGITFGTPGTISFPTTFEGIGWAILLPQDAVNEAVVSSSGFDNGTCNVPKITNNLFYTTGVDVSLNFAVTNTHPFTVSSDGKQVYFSKGNLIGITYSGAYNMLDDQTDSNDPSTLFYFDYVNVAPGWRALTQDEWNYLLRDENGAKWGFAHVNGEPGIIILPDDYSDPAQVYDFHYNHNDFGDIESHPNTYDDYGGVMWTELEDKGAVFLCVKENDLATALEARYWSSTPYGGSYSWCLYFDASISNPVTVTKPSCIRYSSGGLNDAWIRLVKDVDSSKSSQ